MWQLPAAFIVGFMASLINGQNCPEAYGVQTYPNPDYCDKFYKVNTSK